MVEVAPRESSGLDPKGSHGGNSGTAEDRADTQEDEKCFEDAGDRQTDDEESESGFDRRRPTDEFFIGDNESEESSPNKFETYGMPDSAWTASPHKRASVSSVGSNESFVVTRGETFGSTLSQWYRGGAQKTIPEDGVEVAEVAVQTEAGVVHEEQASSQVMDRACRLVCGSMEDGAGSCFAVRGKGVGHENGHESDARKCQVLEEELSATRGKDGAGRHAKTVSIAEEPDVVLAPRLSVESSSVSQGLEDSVLSGRLSDPDAVGGELGAESAVGSSASVAQPYENEGQLRETDGQHCDDGVPKDLANAAPRLVVPQLVELVVTEATTEAPGSAEPLVFDAESVALDDTVPCVPMASGVIQEDTPAMTSCVLVTNGGVREDAQAMKEDTQAMTSCVLVTNGGVQEDAQAMKEQATARAVLAAAARAAAVAEAMAASSRTSAIGDAPSAGELGLDAVDRGPPSAAAQNAAPSSAGNFQHHDVASEARFDDLEQKLVEACDATRMLKEELAAEREQRRKEQEQAAQEREEHQLKLEQMGRLQACLQRENEELFTELERAAQRIEALKGEVRSLSQCVRDASSPVLSRGTSPPAPVRRPFDINDRGAAPARAASVRREAVHINPPPAFGFQVANGMHQQPQRQLHQPHASHALRGGSAVYACGGGFVAPCVRAAGAAAVNGTGPHDAGPPQPVVLPPGRSQSPQHARGQSPSRPISPSPVAVAWQRTAAQFIPAPPTLGCLPQQHAATFVQAPPGAAPVMRVQLSGAGSGGSPQPAGVTPTPSAAPPPAVASARSTLGAVATNASATAPWSGRSSVGAAPTPPMDTPGQPRGAPFGASGMTRASSANALRVDHGIGGRPGIFPCAASPPPPATARLSVLGQQRLGRSDSARALV